MCTMASWLNYKISGNKNCGPTFSPKEYTVADQEAIDIAESFIQGALGEMGEMGEMGEKGEKGEGVEKIKLCRDRLPPDKCNPWLKINSFDLVRIWPTKRRGLNGVNGRLEVEVPLWMYTSEESRDKVLQQAGPTFVMNERYLSAADLKSLDRNDSALCYVTMLRNPTDRAVSHWRHERTNNVDLPPNLGFEEYLNTYLRDNLMVRALCGPSCLLVDKITHKEYIRAVDNMKKMDAVLIMEHYARSLRLLEKACGDGKQWTRFEKNIATHKGSTKALEMLDDKPRNWMTKLRAMNRWDDLLYSEGKRIFFANSPNSIEYAPEDEGGKSTNIQARYISEYGKLGKAFRQAIGVRRSDPLRIKFPSLFITSRGGRRILFNLRNDRICEGYLVSARVAVNLSEHLDDISVSPFDVGKYKDTNTFIRVSSERNELFNVKEGVTLLPFSFSRGSRETLTYTGPEDARVVNSPDGKQAYIVFNCRTREGRRQIAVMDYNKDPSRAVFLGIQGHETRKTEKNWIPFFVSRKHYTSDIRRPENSTFTVEESQAEYILHFVYRIGPTVVLACPNLFIALSEGAEQVECEVVETRTNDIRKQAFVHVDKFGKTILLRGSSSMVEYKWPFYVGLVHSRIPVSKGKSWKPCYRSQLMVMDIEQMLPVHLSESIEFSDAFVRGLNRNNVHDTYNHYATGLYNAGTRWYIGVDFDDQHPVLGELTNLEEYLHRVIRKRVLVYYGNGEGVLRIGEEEVAREDVEVETDPSALHDMVKHMDSANTCKKKRMNTMPVWARLQDKCSKAHKPQLEWLVE